MNQGKFQSYFSLQANSASRCKTPNADPTTKSDFDYSDIEDVVERLKSYLSECGLKGKQVESKNKINPDDKLKNLLGLDTVETNELTFFNIQKYMNKHFISNKPKLNETTTENESSI